VFVFECLISHQLAAQFDYPVFLSISVSNYLYYQAKYSGLLNLMAVGLWILYIIPTFLLVTALLPLAIKLKLPVHVPLWMLMLCAIVVIYSLSLVDFPEAKRLKSVCFYLLWAVFGYHLPNLGIKAYKTIAIISMVALLIIVSVNADARILIMQNNKFPPNAIFFLFSCLWVAIFLTLAIVLQHKSQQFSDLATQWWLKPFLISKMLQPVTQIPSLRQGLPQSRSQEWCTLEHIPVTGYWHPCQYDGAG
jgi:hypothetical protein